MKNITRKKKEYLKDGESHMEQHMKIGCEKDTRREIHTRYAVSDDPHQTQMLQKTVYTIIIAINHIDIVCIKRYLYS